MVEISRGWLPLVLMLTSSAASAGNTGEWSLSVRYLGWRDTPSQENVLDYTIGG